MYPHNPGAEKDGVLSVQKDVNTWKDLAQWARKNHITLAVIGPEQPLVEGISDIFAAVNIPVFGPSKKAAQLEGSKHYSKKILQKYSIPTADWTAVTNKESAQSYIRKQGVPCVIKVSGLAAGKGAIMCQTYEEAENALEDIFDKKAFGDAGNTVVIEEMMEGPEASVFVLTDGTDYKILPVSQDHKRIFDNDQGPNTGGMGAYAPAPAVTPSMMNDIEKRIITPTLQAMQEEEAPYTGLLYIGLMLTETGPKVVEYNCRFGDPETEAVLPLVECDWYDVFLKCARGNIREAQFFLRKESCVTVVLASRGYPQSSEKGIPIEGIGEADTMPGVSVCFAGVAEEAGRYYTDGGRVLAVTGTGNTLKEAISRAYAGVSRIHFTGMQYRTDIGKKACTNCPE
jgi:phosphoribosylamine--glycine ligase